MKLRLFIGLASALALGGCASYGYVDDGGGYYSGGPSTEYVYAPGYGGYGYGSGYGVYGYGSNYYGYRYVPGWSFGLGYGSGFGYGSYGGYGGYGGYPYYSGGYYRPPVYRPRPPLPPRPGHAGNGPEHPAHPPPQGGRPPLDRAPWRDLDHLGGHAGPNREASEGDGPRPNRPPRWGNGQRPDRPSQPEGRPISERPVYPGNGPQPARPARPARPEMVTGAGGAWQGSPPAQRETAGPRSVPVPRTTGQGEDFRPVYRSPAGPRVSREDGSAARQMQPRAMPQERPRREASERPQTRRQNATRDTDER